MEKNGSVPARTFAAISFLLIFVTATGFNISAFFIIASFLIILLLKNTERAQVGPVLEAAYLMLFSAVVRQIFNFLRATFGQIILWAGGRTIGAFSDIFSIFGYMISIATAVLALIGLIGVFLGKSAVLPGLGVAAGKTLGVLPEKPGYYQPPRAPEAAPTPEAAPVSGEEKAQ